MAEKLPILLILLVIWVFFCKFANTNGCLAAMY